MRIIGTVKAGSTFTAPNKSVWCYECDFCNASEADMVKMRWDDIVDILLCHTCLVELANLVKPE